MKISIKSFTISSIILLLLIGSCKSGSVRGGQENFVVAQIDSLLEHKNFFAARKLYQQNFQNLSEFEKLKAGVFLDYAFNRSDSSAYKSEILFSRFKDRLRDSMEYEIKALAHINHSREYEYKKAKESLQQLLANYDSFISEEEKKDLQNTLIIWKALQDQPKQRVVKNDRLELPLFIDKASLKNLTVTSGDVKENFIFDTGANISTISETTAEKFGVKVLSGSFEVDAITGNKINSQIGIAPRLEIGPVIIYNAVCLIFPDDALSISQLDYQINGILGFPVLEALDEIQITRDNILIVPVEQTHSREGNLAIDFLTPLLFLKDNQGAGVYTFDISATESMLYDTYFKKHRAELENAAEVDYSFGGAGGVTTKKGLYTSFSPIVNGRAIKLDQVIVLKEAVTPNNYFYGNIGQDLIDKFEKMIINFDKMFLSFE
ncbi:retropepsin-like domain-containing protein [Antarcticibacterium sp. 1MA-6-2]|uniref:retropepsin-like aspartic protease family protein n=1 Tax=Antarcticibacterium sp. 1MA-6-2 TaxID=2908210 RepID=UPI001F2E30E0|nr:retropepsin-like aspartic protease [Antarcticibacterium sp. 1MA-6-2]UJH90913.1 retropepsin-like domain-containing protein [Antarcticibacterium sp. 1MA-6-2]